MASKVPKATREVAPLVQAIRNFLLGRDPKIALRFKWQQSSHPGPEPNLPEGPSHKLSGNYYFTRDGRREVKPPTVLADASGVKSLEAGAVEGTDAVAAAPAASGGKKSKAPGAMYRYSQL